MPLSLEQFKELRARGLSVEQIASFEKGYVPQKEKGFLTKLGEGLKDVVRESIVKTGVSGIQAARGLYGLGKYAVTGDISSAEQATKPINVPFFGEVAPVSTPRESVGTGIQVGTLLAPAGKLGLVGRSAKLGLESAAFEAGSQIKEGEFNKQAIIEQGLVGVAIPVVGKALSTTTKGITKGVGKIATESLGKTTGAGEFAIREAFENPNVIKFARQAGVQGVENLQEKALADAFDSLRIIKNNRATSYLSKLNEIKLDKTSQDRIVDTVGERIKELVSPQKFDIDIIPTAGGAKIDFSRSTIIEGQGAVQKAINDMATWSDNTPAGLDVLKKRLGDYISQAPMRTPARAFLTDIRSTLTKELETSVPKYKEMTKGYQEASEIIDEIEKSLSLKDKIAQDTAIRKLMSTMRQNNEFRKELLATLDEVGGKDITGQIAGSTLASYAPRGLSGVMVGPASIYSLINPSTLPMVLMYLAASSPRLVAEFVSLLGQIARGAEVGGEKALQVTPGLENALKRIFGDAEENFGITKDIEAAKKLIKATENIKPGLIIEDVSKRPKLTKESRGQTYLSRDEVSKIQEEAAINEQRLESAALKKESIQESLIEEAKKYKSAEEFVRSQETPKTVSVWNKSKFSNNGSYADIPVIRKEENITLYQGGKDGDGRQFWTPDKKYAKQFGNVKEKTGSFYKIDNGNRVTDVYVEAPDKSQLTDIWNKANKSIDPLIQEAKKYKSAEEFYYGLSDSSLGGIGQKYDGVTTKIRPIEDFNLGEQRIGKINRTQRLTSPEAVNRWKEKIKNGERPPILIRSGLSESQEWIADGHNRLKAYQELGFKEVPTITKSQLTDIWNKANKK